MRNFGQRKCRYCGSHGGDFGRHNSPCLSPEELAALKEYVKTNGRTWRSKLREAWTRDEPILREVRNRVGPSKLDLLKPV
jgi:hypothetical protein